ALPIERVLSDRFHKQINRFSIAEVGNLISNQETAGRILVDMIPLLAWSMGAKYLICTVTPKVQRMMEACQIVFEPLIMATPEGLTDRGKKDWGTYYSEQPVTGFIRIDPKRSRFAELTMKASFHLPIEESMRAAP
ncbi:thermostable hemolysin, partial [Pseudomonas sp. 5S4]